MKITYYITEPDGSGWSAILIVRDWDVSIPAREASEGWPCVGVVNADGDIEAFDGPKADRNTLRRCGPLKPGMSFTMEELK